LADDTAVEGRWIVMEGRAGMERFWGWCHLRAGETAFDEVRLTDCSGMGEPRKEIDAAAMVLGPVLFVVPDAGRWEAAPPRPTVELDLEA